MIRGNAANKETGVERKAIQILLLLRKGGVPISSEPRRLGGEK